MSLSAAINTAQQIFSNTGQQTAIVSKNIANSGNADYVRRLAMMGVDAEGGYYIKIQRAQNEALFKQTISSLSAASGQNRLLDGLTHMQSVFGGNDYASSPSNYLAKFRSSLQTYAASPGNITIASSTVADAKDLAYSVSTSAAAVQDIRADADREILEQVGTLNGYLTKFEKINNEIVGNLATGKDASDALDERDSLLKQMAEIVGISTVTRSNMDTVIYSADGTVLFETLARKVTFTPTATFDATVTGNPVYVDGVPLKAGTGGNTTGEGTLASLVQLRDDVAPKMQSQLDEVARMLVTMFQENGGPGLFTWSGGTIPAAGTIEPGIAASLVVNPIADADPTVLRDGGFNGLVSNTSGNAAYTTLLDSYIVAMNATQSFDVNADLGGSASIMTYASSSIGWLEQLRKAASTSNDNKMAMLSQTQQALSNDTGVSLDEELALMLDLEQSYKASAKLLSTVDEMLTTLLNTVR
ncbi:flagellar hook-associated protein FlgK [Rhizobium sp. 32-5/1]|uniref:flagellar hook-associated protein FlgK n=1 Tax=Rhizobium sp. 32-5/1 TaxID=3019602 RepID=UPI00240D6EEE|nr:flagellar hook-associated protein FlgK [Rhizobium sp. 32-5/1]WEZ84397.1 flagellar hook-associated protein FlgK [Rhizobium sp. 32-5/1]